MVIFIIYLYIFFPLILRVLNIYWVNTVFVIQSVFIYFFKVCTIIDMNSNIFTLRKIGDVAMGIIERWHPLSFSGSDG